MKKSKIQDTSLGYNILRIYERFLIKLYYSEIVVEGKENLPKDTPIILAPNHQNAVMDALLILSTVSFQPVFMARADMFKKPFIIKLLTFIKIMPAYRIRDGFSNLNKNDEVFDKAIDALHDRKVICIMAEGNHGDQRKLRPLVKGIFRIALKAQEEKGIEPYVKIVPVGLDFSHYSHFRARVVIRYGKPIDVSEYYVSYEQNQPLAYNELRERLAEGIKNEMLHIESSEYYDTVWNLKDIFRNTMFNKLGFKKKSTSNLFKTDQHIINAINTSTQTDESPLKIAKDKIASYQKSLKELGLRTWLLDTDRLHWITLVIYSLLHLILLPIFVYGYINNSIVYHLPMKLVSKIKDEQFHSSVKFVVGLLLSPFIFGIQTLIVYLAFDSGTLAGLYFITLYLTGILAFDYFIYSKKLIAMWKYKLLQVFNKSKMAALKHEHDDIIRFTEQLIDQK